MTVPVPPPHLLKKFSNQARDSSFKRGAPNYLKGFAMLCIEWALNSKATSNDRQIRSSVPEAEVEQWGHDCPVDYNPDHWGCEQYIASSAADWELEACCEWFVGDWTDVETADRLRAARRPKPPSLKEQALTALKRYEAEEWCEEMTFDSEIIRRAIEALPDD